MDALDAGWWGVISRKPWITLPVFQRAVLLTLGAVKDHLPPVAEFVAICEIAKGELDDEERRALPRPDVASLPAPDVTRPPVGYPLEKWDRHVAIGKARARRRKAGEQDIQPSETEVDALLREMAERRELKGALETALRVRVPVVLEGML